MVSMNSFLREKMVYTEMQLRITGNSCLTTAISIYANRRPLIEVSVK